MINKKLTSVVLSLTLSLLACGDKNRLGGEKTPPTSEKPTPPHFTDNQKVRVINLFYKVKYTNRLTSMLAPNENLDSFYTPEVDDKWVDLVKKNCAITAEATPKYLDRIIYNKNLRVTKEAGLKDNCPMEFTQEIHPEVQDLKLRIVHNVPLNVNLKTKATTNFPKNFLGQMNLTGKVLKDTSFTSFNSGKSEIKESVYGVISENSSEDVFLRYIAKIDFKWDNQETTKLEAELFWHFTIDNDTLTIKEICKKDEFKRVNCDIYLNEELIPKTDIKKLVNPELFILVDNEKF